MNKLLTLFLVLLTTFSYAQKGKVYSAATSLSSGDYVGAKKLIDEALESESAQEMAKAWITKGEIYNSIFEFGLNGEPIPEDAVAQAEEAFKKAYELDMAAEKKPGKNKEVIFNGLLNSAKLYNSKGISFYEGKEFDNAYKYFVKAGELVTYLRDLDGISNENEEVAQITRTESYQNAALSAINLKDYDKAIFAYTVLIELGVETEDIYANLSIIYLSNQNFDDAKSIIEKGRSLYPDNQSLVESELNYYIGTNQSDIAVNKLNDAIEKSPNDTDLYFNLALAYDKLDRKDEMITAYEKIIELDPDYYGAYLNLGAYYNDKANEVIKEMNEMTDYKAANAMIPKRDEWYNKAIPYLEKALALQPDSDAVKAALKRIFANMNLLDKVKALD